MKIWRKPVWVTHLNAVHKDTAVERLGMEFTEVGDDFITARVPVDKHGARQPYGILHGGVSVVLAEALGSCGAAYSSPEGHRAVGLDINAKTTSKAPAAAGHRDCPAGPPRPHHPCVADRAAQ